MKKYKKRCRILDAEEDEDDDESEELIATVWRKGQSVYFHADVTKRSVCMLFNLLKEASSEALLNNNMIDEPKIILYIHSNGGDAYAGLSAMDHVSKNRVPVITCADGFVASAATLILLGGSVRVSLPHSNILIHQLRTGFIGKFDELKDEMQNSEALMETFKKIYVSKTRMTRKTVDTIILKELNLNAEESMKYGIVSKII